MIRPNLPDTCRLAVRAPRPLLAALDEAARAALQDRSELVRLLLREGLERRQCWPPRASTGGDAGAGA